MKRIPQKGDEGGTAFDDVLPPISWLGTEPSLEKVQPWKEFV
jgi:hypothetical protein